MQLFRAKIASAQKFKFLFAVDQGRSCRYQTSSCSATGRRARSKRAVPYHQPQIVEPLLQCKEIQFRVRGARDSSAPGARGCATAVVLPPSAAPHRQRLPASATAGRWWPLRFEEGESIVLDARLTKGHGAGGTGKGLRPAGSDNGSAATERTEVRIVVTR